MSRNKKIYLMSWLFALSFWAMPAAAWFDPVSFDFLPNQPVLIENTDNSQVQYLCEMHVSSSSNNTLLINQLKGRSVINGTSIATGGSSYLTVRQMQSVEVILQGRSKIKLTNVGNFLIRAICYA